MRTFSQIALVLSKDSCEKTQSELARSFEELCNCMNNLP